MSFEFDRLVDYNLKDKFRRRQGLDGIVGLSPLPNPQSTRGAALKLGVATDPSSEKLPPHTVAWDVKEPTVSNFYFNQNLGSKKQ